MERRYCAAPENMVASHEAVAKLASGEVEVDLSDQGVTDETAVALGKELATNTVVIKLDLSGAPHPRHTLAHPTQVAAGTALLTR